jgi:uncharacterized membrane protein YfcA
MTPAEALLTAGAGLIAGAVNAVAGGGTLITFPALLAAGLNPVAANITSSVGLLAGYLGGSVAYRAELAEQRGRVRVFALPAVVGGVVGAILLLVTPESTFRSLVPYLVLTSCALLAVQPRLARLLQGAHPQGDGVPIAARLGVGVAAIYGSYFGAGLGVLLLALLGILIADTLQRLNALKGLLSLLVNLTGVAVFVLSGQVAWLFALILDVTAYVGGTLGVGVARRLPASVLRGAVIALGTTVGIVLLVR